MATDFDRFLAGLVGGGMPPVMPNVAPQAAPVMAPPVQPQRQPSFQDVAAGIPPNIAQMVARAAVEAGVKENRQGPAPFPMAQNIASTAPVIGAQPVQLNQQQPQESRSRVEGEPTGYLLVELPPTGDDPGMQGQMVLVPQGVGYTVPPNARVMGNGDLLTDPAAIDRARQQNMLLDQQDLSIQVQFMPKADQQPQQAEQELIPTEQAPAPDPSIPSFTTQEMIASGDEELARMGVSLEEAGITTWRTDQIIMVRPEDGSVYLATEDEIQGQNLPVHISTLGRGNPELAQELQGYGIEYVRPDGTAITTDGEEANLAPEDQASAQQGALTPETIRAMGDDATFANGTMTPQLVAYEMERWNIPEVPADSMLVVHPDSRMELVPAADVAPDGTTIVMYGGKTDREKPSVFGTPADLMGVVTAGMNKLDIPRQLNVGNRGQDAYEWAVSGAEGDYTGREMGFGEGSILENADPLRIWDNAVAGDFNQWVSANPQVVKDVYENGYTDEATGRSFTGGDAVWERFVKERPQVARAVMDILDDPLNYTPTAGGVLRRGGTELLQRSGSLQNTILGGALDLTGRVLNAPDDILRLIPAAIRDSNIRVSGGPRYDDVVPSGADVQGDLGRFTPNPDDVQNVMQSIPGVGRLFERTTDAARSKIVEPVAETVQDILARVADPRLGRNLPPGQGPNVGGPPTVPGPQGAGPLTGTPLEGAMPNAPVAGRYPDAPEGLGLSPQETAVYNAVGSGQLPIERVIPQRILSNVDRGGTLGRLSRQDVESMTPVQIAVYNAERNVQLEAAGMPTTGARPGAINDALGIEPQIVTPGSTRGLGLVGPQGQPIENVIPRPTRETPRPADILEQRRSTQQRLDAVLGQQPVDTGGLIVPTARRRDADIPTPDDAPVVGLAGTPLERAVPQTPMTAAPEIPYDPLRGTMLGANRNPELAPAPVRDTPQAQQQLTPEGTPAPQAPTTPRTPDETATVTPSGTPAPNRPRWSFATPDDAAEGASRNRIVERAWRDGQQNPAELDAFIRQHDAKARAFTDQQDALTRASIAEREGGTRTGFDYATEARKQVDEAEYVLDLVGDFNTTIGRSTGPVQPTDYNFRHAESGRDVYHIEQAIFGDGGQRARGIGTLRSRANRDPALQELLPRIEAAAGKWDRYRAKIRGQQPIPEMGQAAPAPRAQETAVEPPAVATAAPSPEGTSKVLRMTIRGQQYEIRSVPIARVRPARELTPEQRQALGISDYQMRDAEFAESTARNVQDNFDVNLLDPLKAVLGSDGNYYVTSGHSRLRGFQNAGDTEVPVQIMVGDEQRIRSAALRSNTSSTELKPTERGTVIRRLMDEEGMTFDDAIKAQNYRRTVGEQYLWSSYIDPSSDLGMALNTGQMPLNKASRIGKAIMDDRLTTREADSMFRSLFGSDGKTGAGRVMTLDNLESEIDNLYRWKIELGDDANALGLQNIESDRFKLAQARSLELKKDLAQLERRRAHFNAVGADTNLTAAQRAKVAEIQAQIDDVRRQMIGAETDQREAFFAGNRTEEPSFPTVDMFGNPVAAPPAVRSRLDQEGMDLGDAGRPQMQGGRAGTPGEALDSDDLLQQPERTAAQAMRESGANPLFDLGITPNPLRDADFWYRHTLGAEVRNPTARVRSPFLVEDSAPIDRRLDLGVLGENLPEHEFRALNQRFSDSDETLFTRWNRYFDDMRAESPDLTREAQAALSGQRVFHDWNLDTLRRLEPKKAAKYDAEYARLMEKKDADAFRAQVEAMETAMGRDVPQNFYDSYLGVMRELKLYNPITGSRYVATQAVGNTITLMLTLGMDRGLGVARRLWDREAFRSTLGDVRGTKVRRDFLKPVTPEEAVEAFRAEELLTPGITMDQVDWQMQEFGIVARRDIIREVRDETMGIGTTGGPTRTARFFGRRADQVNRLRLGKTNIPKETPAVRRAAREERDARIGNFTGWLSSKNVRDYANAFDVGSRRALWSHTMSANIATVRQDFFQQLRDNLPNQGEVARLDDILNTLPAEFGAARLRTALEPFGGNYAERMSRDWRSALGRMDKNARSEVNRILFSGDETRADAAIRRVFMFHYWMSRATPLYTEALMKNPGVANAYFKMIQEGKEQAESGQYGSAVRGMMKVLDSWMGYNLFIRPDAFMQTVFALGNDQKFTDEEASQLWKFMDSVGLMPSPMVDAFLNMTGYQGDNTFTPDLLGMSTHFNFGSSMIDYAKVQMGLDVSEPTQLGPETVLAWARQYTSGVLYGSTNVDFSAPDSFAMVEIRQNALDIFEEEGKDWDDPVHRAVFEGQMNDPDSPLYRAAFERYATSNAAEWGLRFIPVTAILYPKLRQGGADRRRYELNNAEEGSPEQQRLRDQREWAITTDQDTRTLRMQSDEYQRLGTKADQDAYRQYNAIRLGGVEGAVRVDRNPYTERELRGMTVDQRTAVADAWAAEQGVTDAIDRQKTLREEYREAHPEYAAYYDWSMSVRDGEGPIANWQQIVRDNPNAARWYRDTITEDMPLDQIERELTGMNAFIATQGMRPSAYDANPISTGNGATATGIGNGESQYPASDPATGIAEDIASYRQEAAEIDSQLAALFGEGTTWATIENANPTLQAALLQHMEQAGVSPPSLSRRATAYLEWAESQPPGSDTTIDAFLTWQEQFSTDVTVPANAGSLPVDYWTGTTPP